MSYVTEKVELNQMNYSSAYRIFKHENLELTDKEKFHYLNLEKGYEGEVKFDQLTNLETLREERYIINDLLTRGKQFLFSN